MKKIASVMVLGVSLFLMLAFSNQEIEYWGFCTATNGTTMYVSSAIKFPIGDAQLGFPNTKVIRTWRLVAKEELGDYYNDSDFKLKLYTEECNRGLRYHSRLEAEQGRQCFMDKIKGQGRKVKTIAFIY